MLISGRLWELAADTIPGLVRRPAQDAAFTRVLDRLGGEEDIVPLEGEPGIGKSLLVAPLLLTGRRVIYSARTKNQQRQMRDTTVPTLVRAGLVTQEKVAVLFGRSNYFCDRRRDVSVKRAEKRGDEVLADELAAIDWREDGNREHYPELSGQLWAQVCSDDEDGCSHDCLDGYQMAKQHAETCSLLITNHSVVAILTMINLRRSVEWPSLLFNRDDLLVLDEAHRMPEVLDDVYATTVSARRLTKIDAEASEGGVTLGLGPWAVRWEETCKKHDREDAWKPEGIELAEELVAHLDKKLIELRDPALLRTTGPTAIREATTALAGLLPDVQLFAELRTLEHSRSVVAQKTQHVATARRFNLAPEGRKTLAFFSSCVPMSATLTGLPMRQLGIEDTGEVVADAPFDLASHRLAYLTTTVAEPDWYNPRKYPPHQWSENELGWLVHHSQGGALVVATSHEQKRRAADALRGFGWRVAEQGPGTDGLAELVEMLRRGDVDVLVGTDGVGTGTDIPGPALRLVVVLSHPNPNTMNDPHLRQMSNRMKDRGEDPWKTDFALRAELALRQAIGRLVRGPEDTGVVAFLEARPGYHETWQRLVGPSPVTRELDAVGAFFAAGR